jgi:hypothetical protein
MEAAEESVAAVLAPMAGQVVAEQPRAQAEKAYIQDRLISAHQGKDTMAAQAPVPMVPAVRVVVVVAQVVPVLPRVLVLVELA